MRAARLADFPEIWLCDFEYGVDANKRQRPRCMVAVEWHSGREIRIWGDKLYALRRAPFGVEPSQVFVAYSSPAELRCCLELDWALPQTILDLYVEFRWLFNGRRAPAGYSLVGALTAFGLDSLDAAEKEDMRALALRGFPYTADERRSLLDYCASDVYALRRLLPAMEPYLDFPRAFLRGRYMRAVARMMQTGVPVDRDRLASLRQRWGAIKADLIAAVDGPYGVYDGSTFRAARWLGWCRAHGVPWPQLQSGAPQLDRDAFQTMAEEFPEVRPIGELRTAMGQMKATNVIAGPDGRNRAWLGPFGTITGRNAPPSSEFLFGASAWLRHVIQAPPGAGVAYLDWEQQEIGIAAVLSGDPALTAAYTSGDPYLAFGKQVGAIPPQGTKESHGKLRERFKACMLGMGYGMGEECLARQLGLWVAQARELIRQHHATYRVFWRWIADQIEDAYLRGLMETVFGWRLWGITPYRRRQGRMTGVSPRTLQNFPAQAHGAEMLRLAVCLLTEHGIAVCAPVHDAVLIEAPLAELDDTVAEAKRLMAKASEAVLSGFRLRTEAAVYRYPEHYREPKGAEMWALVSRLLQTG